MAVLSTVRIVCVVRNLHMQVPYTERDRQRERDTHTNGIAIEAEDPEGGFALEGFNHARCTCVRDAVAVKLQVGERFVGHESMRERESTRVRQLVAHEAEG